MNAHKKNRWFTSAQAGDVATLRAMIASGADVNAADKGGWTALHEAAAYGCTEAVEVLLRAGANVCAVTAHMTSALHLAVSIGRVDVVRALIRAGADVNARDADGDTPRRISPTSFRATFDRLVDEVRSERVHAAARVRKSRRPPRPRL